MATQFHINPFTGKFDKVIDPTEHINHSELTDMPDSGGTNTDHDARYWTLTTDQTGLTGDKSGSFDLTTTGDVTVGGVRTIGAVSVTYDGDFVDEVTVNSRVVTFTNDGTDYTKWEDSGYTWTPTYDGDGKLTAIGVVAK